MIQRSAFIYTYQDTSPINIVNTNLQKSVGDYGIICELACQLTKSQKLIFNSLLGYFNEDEFAYPSIETLASKVGCCESTARTAVKRLAEFKFISYEARIYDTHVFELADEFYDPELRALLSDLFCSLVYMPHKGLNFDFQKLHPTNMNINIISHVNFADAKKRTNQEVWDRVRHKMEVETPSGASISLHPINKKSEYSKSYVATQVKQGVNQYPQMENEAMSQSVLIPKYIENVDVVRLSFDDKVELAHIPESIITRASHVTRMKAANGDGSNMLPYFKAVCKREFQKSPGKSFSKLDGVDGASTNKRQASMKQQPWSGDPTIAQIVKDSWNKPIDEMMAMRARGLANIKDPAMRKQLGDLFDLSMKQHRTAPLSAGQLGIKDKCPLLLAAKFAMDYPDMPNPHQELSNIRVQQLISLGEDVSAYVIENIHYVEGLSLLEEDKHAHVQADVFFEDIVVGFTEPIENTSIIHEISESHSEIVCNDDDSGYESINTHHLFQ